MRERITLGLGAVAILVVQQAIDPVQQGIQWAAGSD
jgi:hypothetical protein